MQFYNKTLLCVSKLTDVIYEENAHQLILIPN